MKLVSSSPLYHKRLFPIIWFGFLALVVVLGLTKGFDEGAEVRGFVGPLVMAIGGYYAMKKYAFDLIDEVYDDGESLMFKNRGTEVRVQYKDIKNISFQKKMNPKRITVELHDKSELGCELSYIPLSIPTIFNKCTEIEEFIDRIDKARNQQDI